MKHILVVASLLAAAPVQTHATLAVQILLPGAPAFTVAGSGSVSVAGSTVFVPRA